MASTSYLARVIYKEHTTDGSWAGSYDLLVRAKSIPSPVQAPNTVESTTLEDPVQTFEMGIKQSGTKDYTGNLEKEYLESISALASKKLDIITLYGTDGLGGVAKYGYVSNGAVATPSDVGGVDSILEMTVTTVPSTAPELITDDITVTYNTSTKKFTVANAT